MSFCTNCGKPFKEATKFCTSCGKLLDNKPVPASVSNSNILNKSSTETTLRDQVNSIGEAESNNLFPKRSNKWKWLSLAAILFIAISIATYFLFFANTSDTSRILYVLPDNLKLRSSQYDNSDANILTSANYGSPINIINDEGEWVKVKFNAFEGYMRKRYLTDSKDFFETDAIIHTIGIADTIRETRFKKSLLAYFRQHNYKPPFLQVTDYIQQTFLSDSSVYKNKEEWKIVQFATDLKTFVKGKFTNSSKPGMAVVIEKSNDISGNRKLLIFNYDDAENELPVTEYTANFSSINFLNKSDKFHWFFNGGYQLLSYNALRAVANDAEYIFMYNGITMQPYVQPIVEGD